MTTTADPERDAARRTLVIEPGDPEWEALQRAVWHWQFLNADERGRPENRPDRLVDHYRALVARERAGRVHP